MKFTISMKRAGSRQEKLTNPQDSEMEAREVLLRKGKTRIIITTRDLLAWILQHTPPRIKATHTAIKAITGVNMTKATTTKKFLNMMISSIIMGPAEAASMSIQESIITKEFPIITRKDLTINQTGTSRQLDTQGKIGGRPLWSKDKANIERKQAVRNSCA